MSTSGPNWPNNLQAPVLTAGMLSQVASGTLPATTYFVKITLVNAQGESLPSGEQSLAVALNNVLSVASPAAEKEQPLPGGGATGWNVYVGTASGSETKQNAAPVAMGTAWQEPNGGLIAGALVPVTDSSIVPGQKARTNY